MPEKDVEALCLALLHAKSLSQIEACLHLKQRAQERLEYARAKRTMDAIKQEVAQTEQREIRRAKLVILQLDMEQRLERVRARLHLPCHYPLHITI